VNFEHFFFVKRQCSDFNVQCSYFVWGQRHVPILHTCEDTSRIDVAPSNKITIMRTGSRLAITRAEDHMMTTISLALFLAGLIQAAPSPTGVVQGTVVREGTSEPIAGAKVTLGGGGMNLRQAEAILSQEAIGASVPPEAIALARVVIAQQTVGGAAISPITAVAVTDDAGHFSFPEVPAGNLNLRVELEGYFGPATNGFHLDFASTLIAVKANETSKVKVSLIPGGTVSGKVFDANGKPFFNAIVAVFRPAYVRGQLTLSGLFGKTADDLGEYRLYPLPPGEYYVSVSPRVPGARASDIPAAREIQVTTLFPNAVTLDAATKVVVPMGDQVRGVDIRVRNAPTSTISGRVTSTFPPIAPRTGRGGAAIPNTALISLASRDSENLSDLIGGMTATAGADGTFKIPNVTPGIYDLYARMPIDKGWGGLAPPERATNPAAFGRATVEVRAGTNVEGVQIVVHQGTDVRGRIAVDGSTRPAKVSLNMIADDSIDRVGDNQTSSVYSQVTQYRPVIAEDSSFSIPVVPEGHYRFAVQIQDPPNAYVADIRQGNTSVYDNGLLVGPQTVNPLEVDIRTNGGSVEATVVGNDLKPASGKTVVLVPASSRRQNPSLYRIANTDAQGHVALANLAPGQYKLFAWDSVPTGAWMNAEFIAKVEERGTAVTVNAGARQSAQLKLIPGN
jgi:hypothetical protein